MAAFHISDRIRSLRIVQKSRPRGGFLKSGGEVISDEERVSVIVVCERAQRAVLHVRQLPYHHQCRII